MNKVWKDVWTALASAGAAILGGPFLAGFPLLSGIFGIFGTTFGPFVAAGTSVFLVSWLMNKYMK